MPLASRVASLLRNLLGRARVERELDQELAAYVDELTEQLIREGVPAGRARRAALIQIGGVQQVKERTRAVRTGAFLERLGQQLRYAVRAMAGRPAMSLLLVITTGLGIGATTAVFTVVDAALFRPPAFREPDRLLELWTLDPTGRAYPRLDPERTVAWTHQPALFADAQQYTVKTMLLGGSDEPEEVRVAFVSPGLFAMLGVPAATGRTFGAAEGPFVAVVSDAFRRLHRLDSIPRGAARIRLDENQYTVVGAMPAGFRFPIGGAEIWLPLPRDPVPPAQAVNVVARLRPGLPRSALHTRLDAVAGELANASPRADGWAVTPRFLDEPAIDAGGRRTLWVLGGAVLCMLVVACVNAANLLLVSGTRRQREVGVRLALGATRGRLVADLLLENVVLAAVAAVTGIAIACQAVRVILRVAPAGFVDIANRPVGIDGRVLGFAVATSLLAWLLCSIAPALQTVRTRESLAWSARGASAGRGLRRVRSAFVVAELAMSVVLMSGAALFTRSLTRLLAVDPGFDIEHVVFADLGLGAGPPRSPEARAALLDAIGHEVGAVPGVRSVSFATGLPPNAPTSSSPGLEGDAGAEAMHGADLAFAEVDTAFFSSLGVPILRGRAFTHEDIAAAAPVVVINRPLARALWADRDPLGRRLRLAPDAPWRTVVGVAGDLKLVGPDDRSSPYAVYYPRPVLGRATRIVSMAVRTSGDPRGMVTGIRNAIRRVGPTLPISRLGGAGTAFAESTTRPRFIGVLMACFALVAVVLAASGAYGVFAYAVTQRTREIGIRMALGAHRADVTRALLKEALLLAAGGLAIGLAGVAASGRAIAALLFGVSPTDPVILLAVALVLVAVSLAATLVPALRASRISPMIAISVE